MEIDSPESSIALLCDACDATSRFLIHFVPLPLSLLFFLSNTLNAFSTRDHDFYYPAASLFHTPPTPPSPPLLPLSLLPLDNCATVESSPSRSLFALPSHPHPPPTPSFSHLSFTRGRARGEVHHREWPSMSIHPGTTLSKRSSSSSLRSCVSSYRWSTVKPGPSRRPRSSSYSFSTLQHGLRSR